MQEAVWTSVRGAAVQAFSPAKRGRSAAQRLDGGEHTRTLSLDGAVGDRNILGSTEVQNRSQTRDRQQTTAPTGTSIKGETADNAADAARN